MTDLLALVRTRLLAITGVTALVSTRVYSGLLPQTATLPAVSLQKVGRETAAHLRGADGLADGTVQVHCVAKTRSGAVAILEAIEGNGAGSALPYFRGKVSGIWVHAITPTPLEREEYRGGALDEYEVMRGYRVQVRR